MSPERKIRIGVVVASLAAQGVVFGKLMHDQFRLIDQANYLVDILKRNEVPITDFDMIAMRNLGFKMREN